jgi:hypothetical protein
MVGLMFTLGSVAVHAQELEWAKGAGGSILESGESIAVDGLGNSYVTGRFHGLSVFGAGEPNETTLTAVGTHDIFVAKYASDGNLVWVKQGGSGLGYGIDVDGAGTSYVTGGFSGTSIFGAGEANETELVSYGGSDVVVAKYDLDGTLLWAKQAGGDEVAATGTDQGRDIAVDAVGDSYVTGYFRGTAIFGVGEPNQTTLTASGDTDIFVARYDPDGALLWVKQAGGDYFDQGYGIAVDEAGSSYVSGFFQDTVVFGVGEPNQTTLTGSASFNMFLARYNPDGSLLWVKQAGADIGYDIAVDDADRSYVTGFFIGNATFGAGEPNETTLSDPGNRGTFVAAYDAEGALLWATQTVGSGSDEGHGIAVDGAGSSYVTGEFTDTAIFGAGQPNETPLTSSGYEDIFVARYDSQGSLLWATRAGGSETGVEHDSDRGHGVAVDQAGNSYVTGRFHGSAVFGAGEPNETTLTDPGNFGMFVAKYHPGPASTVDILAAMVQQLVDDGSLGAGVGNSLTRILENLARSLEQGRIMSACGQLTAFINEVQALILSGRLTPESGQPLLDGANSLFGQYCE